MISLLLMSAGSLTGCRGPDRRNNALDAFNDVDMPLPVTSALDTKYVPKSKNTSTADPSRQSGSAAAASQSAITQLFEDYEKSTGTAKRQIRDRIALKIMTHIKHYHEGTSDDLYVTASTLETLFDLVGITAGGLAGVLGDSSTKAALGVAAAGAIGTRNSLEKNILAEQTKFAIVLQMDALRTEKEAKILTRLKTEDDPAYPMEAVVSDLYDYFNAGSIRAAVASLVKVAQESKSRADAQKEIAAQAETRSIQFAEAELGRIRARAEVGQTRTKDTTLIAGFGQLVTDTKAEQEKGISEAYRNAEKSEDEAKEALDLATKDLASIQSQLPPPSDREAQIEAKKRSVADATTKYKAMQNQATASRDSFNRLLVRIDSLRERLTELESQLPKK